MKKTSLIFGLLLTPFLLISCGTNSSIPTVTKTETKTEGNLDEFKEPEIVDDEVTDKSSDIIKGKYITKTIVKKYVSKKDISLKSYYNFDSDKSGLSGNIKYSDDDIIDYKNMTDKLCNAFGIFTYFDSIGYYDMKFDNTTVFLYNKLEDGSYGSGRTNISLFSDNKDLILIDGTLISTKKDHEYQFSLGRINESDTIFSFWASFDGVNIEYTNTDNVDKYDDICNFITQRIGIEKSLIDKMFQTEYSNKYNPNNPNHYLIKEDDTNPYYNVFHLSSYLFDYLYYRQVCNNNPIIEIDKAEKSAKIKKQTYGSGQTRLFIAVPQNIEKLAKLNSEFKAIYLPNTIKEVTANISNLTDIFYDGSDEDTISMLQEKAPNATIYKKGEFKNSYGVYIGFRNLKKEINIDFHTKYTFLVNDVEKKLDEELHEIIGNSMLYSEIWLKSGDKLEAYLGDVKLKFYLEGDFYSDNKSVGDSFNANNNGLYYLSIDFVDCVGCSFIREGESNENNPSTNNPVVDNDPNRNDSVSPDKLQNCIVLINANDFQEDFLEDYEVGNVTICEGCQSREMDDPIEFGDYEFSRRIAMNNGGYEIRINVTSKTNILIVTKTSTSQDQIRQLILENDNFKETKNVNKDVILVEFEDVEPGEYKLHRKGGSMYIFLIAITNE